MLVGRIEKRGKILRRGECSRDESLVQSGGTAKHHSGDGDVMISITRS